MMSLCDEPARKLFISQCCHLVPDNSSENVENRRRWIFNDRKSYSVALIWLQGIIVYVSETENKIAIDDGTGIGQVCSVCETPGFGSWIKKGCYIMIVGELLSNTPNVNIRALKLTELPELNEETSWILEVLDFSKFMEST